MSVFEIRSTVTHRSLMNKSKDDLSRWVMHLLDCRDESEAARVQRVHDLLEANNRYLQEARDARAALKARFDLVAHLARQKAFSEKTFGPGARTKGVVDHIRKELAEIESDPADVMEWVDVVILAFDGAWRAGWEPEAIVAAIVAKQEKNERRTWPYWRTADPDKAIEHDRSADRTTGKADLDRLLADANARLAAMSPEERTEHDRLQRESFMRGMLPTGDPAFD